MHPWHCVFELGQKLWNPERRRNHLSDVWGCKKGHNVLAQGPYRLEAWAVARERHSGSRIEHRTGLTLLSNSTLSPRASCFSIKVQILLQDQWHGLDRGIDLASPNVPWCWVMSVIGKLLQLKLRHPESSGISVLCSPSIPNSQDQKLPVNPPLRAVPFSHPLAAPLVKSGSSGWWALVLSLLPSDGGKSWLKYLMWLSSKGILSSWSWLSGVKVSRGADLGRELVDCIPGTSPALPECCCLWRCAGVYFSGIDVAWA